MKDGFGREIDYLRISVTDRCDLRCVYCMPDEGVEWMPHEGILRYEEILRLGRIFADLGVTRFKITGGEPLVRKGVESLIAGLRAIPGTKSVTLTTNGVTLAEKLPRLVDAGLEGVNVSLDTLDRARYAALTRRDRLPRVLEGLEAAIRTPGLAVKLNCVAMAGREDDWIALAALAKDEPLAVRFIELMPIGLGGELRPCGEAAIRQTLEGAFGPMEEREDVRGNGPCRYFALPGFRGRIGFISAMSHKFCDRCNRVRLTAAGYLKTCLQYDKGVDLAPLLTATDGELRSAIAAAILAKPLEHRFTAEDVEHREERIMSQIGG